MVRPTAFNMKSQYRRVCFTVNLPDNKDWSDYDINALRCELNTDFFICGKETGAEGRKHFQGYLEYQDKKLASAMDKIFRKRFPLPISVHYELARGSAVQNIDYCTKEDTTAYRNGEPMTGQGYRSDIKKIFKDIQTGRPMVDIASENPQLWCQYRRSLDAYQAMTTEPRTQPSKLIFIWGPTGTGKTAHAQELNPTHVEVTRNSEFFIGMRGGEKVVLFDDFNWQDMRWQTFLRMTDRYAFNVNTKGGNLNFAPKVIIFTSNSNPKEWYKDSVPAETLRAIHRRMDDFGEIIHLETFKPLDQPMLTQYYPTAPAAAAGPQQAAPVAAAAAAPTQQPEIIDLTSDDEAPPLTRRTTKLISRPHVDVVLASDDEEEYSGSNTEDEHSYLYDR